MLEKIIGQLIEEKAFREQSGLSAQAYVQEQKGATKKVLDYIHENRLLTS